tara:strand:- start:40 stop:1440 length:1401 start_codon:yes stop_codon:yes gene_type:complete
MSLLNKTKDEALRQKSELSKIGVVVRAVYAHEKNNYDSATQASLQQNLTEGGQIPLNDEAYTDNAGSGQIVAYYVNIPSNTALKPKAQIPDGPTDRISRDILNTYLYVRVDPFRSAKTMAYIGDHIYVNYAESGNTGRSALPYYDGIHIQCKDNYNRAPTPSARVPGKQHAPGPEVDWKKLPKKHVVNIAKGLKTKGDDKIIGVGYPEVTSIALQEHNDWAKVSGKYAETDLTMKEHIRKYWEASNLSKGAVDYRVENPSAEPWSAAYISWVMRESGFEGAASHLTYSKRNKKSQNPNGYWQRFSLINDYKKIVIQVGDVLIQPRYIDADYKIPEMKTIGGFKVPVLGKPKPGISHGDVVYKIDKDTLTVYLSGGNLKNTAKDTGRTLSIDNHGHLKSLSGKGKHFDAPGYAEAYKRGDYVLILKRMQAGPPPPPAEYTQPEVGMSMVGDGPTTVEDPTAAKLTSG